MALRSGIGPCRRRSRSVSPSSNSSTRYETPFSVAHLEDGKNVGMIQCYCRSGFLFESPQAFGISSEVLGQDLDGDVAVQPTIVRAVNFAHSARAERRADFILP